MKLLLIGLDGVRIDVAVPSVIPGNPAFAEPHGSPRNPHPRIAPRCHPPHPPPRRRWPGSSRAG